MKRKKYSLILAAICASFLLSGCLGGRELNERAFAEIMGIEEDGGSYNVSLQLYKSESADGSPDISKSNSYSVTGSGATVSEALSDAELKAGKSLFLGHIKLLVLGKGMSDPMPELLPLIKSGSISPSCPAVYSEKPESAAGYSSKDGLYAAENLMKITDAYVKSGKSVYTPAASLAELTEEKRASFVLPVINAEEESVSFEGAVFPCGENFSGELAESELLGYAILCGKFPRGGKVTLPVTVNGKSAAASVTKAKTSRSADIREGKLRVNAKVKIKVKVEDDPYGIGEKEISQKLCGNIRDTCISAFSSAVWYEGRDIFGIYKLIRRDCPELSSLDREKLLEESILRITVES